MALNELFVEGNTIANSCKVTFEWPNGTIDTFNCLTAKAYKIQKGLVGVNIKNGTYMILKGKTAYLEMQVQKDGHRQTQKALPRIKNNTVVRIIRARKA